METFTFFIGIDIYKATMDWAVVVANKLLFYYQSSNDKKASKALFKQVLSRLDLQTVKSGKKRRSALEIINEHTH